jgi:hypothetical protein
MEVLISAIDNGYVVEDIGNRRKVFAKDLSAAFEMVREIMSERNPLIGGMAPRAA